MSERTKEALDELERLHNLTLPADKQLDRYGELTEEHLPSLIAAARRLQAIEQAGGLTAEDRQILERYASYRTDHSPVCKALRALLASHDRLEAEVERLRGLLRRIHGWDHMDSAADGKYWRDEIDYLLKGKTQ